jgi:hypothetical protein
MPEPLPEQSPPIPPDVIAKAVVQLTLAVEQASELLVAATDLHRRVAELHGTLTEPLVELDRVLTAGGAHPDEAERPSSDS